MWNTLSCVPPEIFRSIVKPSPPILVLVSSKDQQALIQLPMSTVQHPEAEDLVLLLRPLCQTMQLLQDRALVSGPRCQFVHKDVLAGPRGGVPARNREVDGPLTTSSHMSPQTRAARSTGHSGAQAAPPSALTVARKALYSALARWVTVLAAHPRR